MNGNIWEFRVRFSNQQIQLLAFWDKSKKEDTLVIATNGFVKKTQRTPQKEITKAEQIMQQYLNN